MTYDTALEERILATSCPYCGVTSGPCMRSPGKGGRPYPLPTPWPFHQYRLDRYWYKEAHDA